MPPIKLNIKPKQKSDSTKEKAILDFVLGHITPVEIPSASDVVTTDMSPTDCRDFDDLCDLFAKHIEWADVHRDSLAVCLAVSFSVRLPGELIWMFIVGPASSGKTLMTTAISANPSWFYSLSKMTGMYSGWRGKGTKRKDEDEEEVSEGESGSVVSRINDKTLILPDFTTISGMSPQTLMNLLGELRDMYEGKANVEYRNKMREEYSRINFSILAAVTDDIHKINVSDVGERFLKMDVSTEELRGSRFVKAAIRSDTDTLMAAFTGETFDDRRPWMKPIQEMAWGYQQFLYDQFEKHAFIPAFPDQARDRIIAIGQFVSEIRAKVSRSKASEVNYKPRAEHPTRLAKQFTKLTLSLAFVMQRDVDEEVMRIVFKVSEDTAYGYALDICKAIYERYTSRKIGMTIQNIESKLGVSETTARRFIQDLLDTGVLSIDKRPNNSGAKGRNAHYYVLSPRVYQCYHFAKTGELIEETMARNKMQTAAKQSKASNKRQPIKIKL